MPMGRILWRSVQVIALVLVVCLVAVVLLISLVDPNRFKPQISAAVARSTGYHLDLAGDLSWSLYPVAGFEVNDVRLAVAPDAPALVAVENARVGVRVWPLVRGEVEADALVLSGGRIDLRRDREGRPNWQAAVQQAGGATPERDPDPGAVRGGTAGAAGLALAVGRVRIEDVRLDYRDAQTATHWVAEIERLQVEGLRLGDWFALELIARVRPDGQRVLNTEVRSQLRVSPTLDQFDFSELVWNLKADALTGPGTAPVEARVTSASGHYALAQQRIEVAPVELAVANLVATLRLQPLQLGSELDVRGALSIAPFDAHAFARRLAQELPELAGSEALEHVALAARFRVTPMAVAVPDLQVELDESRLTGSLAYALQGSPALRFQLDLDAIDLDNYQVVATPTEPLSEAAGSGPPPSPLAVALAPLALVSADGRVTVGRVKASGLTATNVSLHLRGEDGRVRMESAEAELYAGRFSGTAGLKLQAEQVSAEARVLLDEVQLERLLADLIERRLFRGVLSAEGALAAQGRDFAEILTTLDGPVSVAVSDGAVLGVNVMEQVCKGVAALRNEDVPPDRNWPPYTAFETLRASLVFSDGVGTTDNFSLSGGGLSVSGTGFVDLPRERFDYRVGVRVTGDSESKQCATSERLREIRWPLRCQGSFSDPPAQLCGIDTERLLQMTGEEAVRKLGRELEGVLPNDLRDRLQQWLR